MRSILITLLLLCTVALAREPHPVPVLKDLHKPWVFARASEASTLFIEPHYKGIEPYGHLIQGAETMHWVEFDGKQSRLWKILSYVEGEKELTLTLDDGGQLLVFPYWDIDHCLLIIRKDPNAEENPTRFAVPYDFLPTLPYMEGEG